MWWTLAMALAGDCATVEGAQLVVPTPFTFATGQAELTDDAPVEAVRCALGADLLRTVQIEVHTDSRGSGSYNLRMSQARADAIREALLASGVAPARVTAVGYGELYPLGPNTTAEGRAANRRIELHLAPPSERPPSPLPADRPPVPPAPQPAPMPSLCEQVMAAFDRKEPGSWARAHPSRNVVGEVAVCLSADWDVDRQLRSLDAFRDGWAVSLRLEGEGVEVTLAPIDDGPGVRPEGSGPPSP
jgi:hypothetical protein